MEVGGVRWGNEKPRILLQKPLEKTAEMESPHYCLCSSGWGLLGAGGERGNLGTGAGASALTPPSRIHPAPRSSFPATMAGDSKVKHN